MRVKDLYETNVQKSILLEAGVKPEIVNFIYDRKIMFVALVVREKLLSCVNKLDSIFGFKKEKIVNCLKSGIMSAKWNEGFWTWLYINPGGEIQYVYRNMAYEDKTDDNPRWPSTEYLYFGYIFVNKDGNIEDRTVCRRTYYNEYSSRIDGMVCDKKGKTLYISHAYYPCDCNNYQIPACELDTVINDKLGDPSKEEFERDAVKVDYSTDDWQKIIGIWQNVCIPPDKTPGLIRERVNK